MIEKKIAEFIEFNRMYLSEDELFRRTICYAGTFGFYDSLKIMELLGIYPKGVVA